MNKLSFFVRYYYKKYLLKDLSANDLFWNEYYRRLSRFCNLTLINKDNNEIFITFLPSSNPLKCFLRIGSNDPIPFDQVFIKNEYLPLVRMVQEKEAAANIQYIIDAGGNIGSTTFFLKQYFPAAQITTIEPDESNFIQLQKNIAANGFTDIIPLKAGLWPREAYLNISTYEGLRNQTRLTVNESHAPTSLKGISLSSILTNYKWPLIDILKMDIEGTESILFEDTHTREILLRKVKFLAVEIHDKETTFSHIRQFFIENGFTFKVISETTFAINTRLLNNNMDAL